MRTALPIAAGFTALFGAQATGAGPAPATCFGQPATITSADPEIFGTPGNDVIVALPSGQETKIWAADGDDQVCADRGDQWVVAGGGDDRVTTGLGHDFLEGGAGDDRLLAGEQSDDVAPGIGTDRAEGGGGRDWLNYYDSRRGIRVDLDKQTARGAGQDAVASFQDFWGSPHDDVVRGLRIHGWMKGRGGDDRLYGLSGSDFLVGNDGDDHLIGGVGRDDLEGGAGDDLLRMGVAEAGTPYGESAEGGPGADVMYGSPGRDLFYGNARRDTAYGGREFDKCSDVERRFSCKAGVPY